MVKCNALKVLEAVEGVFANVTYNLRKISENVSLKRGDFLIVLYVDPRKNFILKF